MVLMWLIQRDQIPQPPTTTETTVTTKFTQKLKNILNSRQNWFIALYGGLMIAPTLVLGALWGIPFIMQKCQVAHHIAATVIAMLFFGWAVGAPLLGWLSDRLGRRKIILILSSCGELSAIMAILYGSVAIRA